MRLFKSTLSAAALLTLAAAAGAQTYTDDFNRPDSSNMGPDWAEDNGDFEIQSGRAVGVGFPWDDLSILRHTQYSGTYDKTIISMDVDTQGKVGAAAGMVSGHKFWGGVATKIQDNDGDGKFDRVFFEAAINAGSWHSSPVPIHFDLPTPITAGRMVLSCPDVDTAQVDIYNLGGTLIATGTAGGIQTSSFPPVGTEAVIYTQYSGAAIDNFEVKPATTLSGSPTALSLAAGGTQTLSIEMGPTHAGELYLLLGSASGTSPGIPAGVGVTLPLNSDAYLIYTLTNPNTAPLGSSFGALDGNGAGTAFFTIPPAFDPSLVGITIHHAAVTIGASVTGATDPAPLTFGA